jgi:Domain of unknown function (DUF6378)
MRGQRKQRRQGLPMTAEQLLEQAALVVRDRRRAYASRGSCSSRSPGAGAWSWGREVTTSQTVGCMFEVKAARLTRDPRHLDSITDIAGYAGLLAELLDHA